MEFLGRCTLRRGYEGWLPEVLRVRARELDDEAGRSVYSFPPSRFSQRPHRNMVSSTQRGLLFVQTHQAAAAAAAVGRLLHSTYPFSGLSSSSPVRCRHGGQSVHHALTHSDTRSDGVRRYEMNI